jgi:hypothetical protein
VKANKGRRVTQLAIDRMEAAAVIYQVVMIGVFGLKVHLIQNQTLVFLFCFLFC